MVSVRSVVFVAMQDATRQMITCFMTKPKHPPGKIMEILTHRQA